MRILYPGSFDPVTCGHVDLIRRAAALFDEVVVAVLRNPAKRCAFSVPERVEMLELALEGIPNARVETFDGLTADFARRIQADALLRGIRTVGDYQSEQQMAELNAYLQPGLETVCLYASSGLSSVSSSAVREIGAFGGNLEGLVPACILQRVADKLRTEPNA